MLYKHKKFNANGFDTFREKWWQISQKVASAMLKMASFSKSGSRNMAETCTIDFLYLTSYSTSSVRGSTVTPSAHPF